MLATKWKIYKKKIVTKVTAFILLIIFMIVGVSSALNIYLNVSDYESITVKNYMESNTLSNELRYAANKLEYILKVYKSEENILSGETVKNLDIEDNWQLTNLYNNYLPEKGMEDSDEARKLFWSEKSKEIKSIKDALIKTDLSNFEQMINDLDEPGGLIYYATDGINQITNTSNADRSYYETKDAYVLIDKKDTVLNPENGFNSFSTSLQDTFEDIEGGRRKLIIYAAITDDGLLTRVGKWDSDRVILIKNAIIIILCVILIVSLFIYLVTVTGRTTEDAEVHMNTLDRIFPDIGLLLIIGVIVMSSNGFLSVLNIRYLSENLMKFAMLSLSAVISAFFTVLFLSIVRHIKNRTIIKNSLTYFILSWVRKTIAKIFAGGPLMLKSAVAIIAIVGMSFYCSKVPALEILLAAFAIYYSYTKVRKFRTIQEGIKVAKTGDYDYKIQSEGSGEFTQMAEDINAMTSGMKIAVQNEVKSERLKTELITNVSHDIKTPLTSIISYVDLLKREGLNSPNAPKYLDVLDRKSNRLKTLTEDLFEAAKATSGSIEPNFQKVNVNALIAQILGELDEKIQESKLIFKVNSSKDRIYAKADGRLLSRVMENLLSNIFKYALKESRVYIEISQIENEVIVSFKNISAYELNMPVDELMERFKRGDESRSSEGNGLGLAIAKSLMEIQGGVLVLNIDGDLFKAEIKLSRYE